jgi:hypothetical protein
MSRQPLTRTDMHAEIGIGLEWNVQYHCYKNDKQITKNKTRTHAGDTRFNVETPSNTEGEKTTGASQQNFTISGGVYKRRGLSYNLINPSRRLTRCIYRRCQRSVPYRGGLPPPAPPFAGVPAGHDVWANFWLRYASAQASGDGPRSARQKLASL